MGKKVLNDNLQLMGNDDALILENIVMSPQGENGHLLLNSTRPLGLPENNIYFNEEQEDDFSRISNMPLFQDKNISWYTIKTLGVSKPGKSSVYDNTYTESEHVQIAQILSNLNVPFGLSISCDNCGIVNYNVGIENDSNGIILNDILNASFGLSDYAPAKSNTMKSHTYVASCAYNKRATEELDKSIDRVKVLQWADQMAAIVIGTQCSCSILFQPITESNWLKQQVEFLHECESSLQRYLKKHPQISANRAVTDATSENINKFFSKIHHKSWNTSNNITTTLSISDDYSVFDSEIESFEKDLGYRIRSYEQALLSGWAIQVQVVSDSKSNPDVLAIFSIINNAMCSIGFSCKWEEKGKNSYASCILPSHIASRIISFPTRSFVGLTIKEKTQLELNPPNSSNIKNDDIVVGDILWNGADTKQKLRIPRKEMNRHTIVFGMTGGGKSTTVRSLLSELKDLHYLVIEPVKGEYRVLPGINRFTMHAGDTTGLRMNPFWFPDGSSLQYHIDSLKLIISSAFDLYAAMPNILEQCMYRSYVNCGWDIVTGKNIYSKELPENRLYPTFSTLCKEIEKYLEESAFEGETAGNYRGALLSRMKSFTSGAKGVLLNTDHHIDFEQWEKENVVVELDALADDADKAIVMGALLVQYFQYIKLCSSHQQKQAGLKHLFVIEEAHHLFRENQSQSQNGTNASGQLVSMLNNLLAEIRAYGEGFIIIDQSPSSISSSVLKNTAVKIVHRVDYGEDIKLLQSALLIEEGNNITASLAAGEALIRFGSMQSPAHIAIQNYEGTNNQLELHSEDRLKTSGVINYILTNQGVYEAVRLDSYRLMNNLLYCSDLVTIKRAIQKYRNFLKMIVSHSCGYERVSDLTDSMYSTLISTYVFYAAEATFPKEFCLQEMIKLYVERTISLEIDDTSSGITPEEWVLLSDYRFNRIHIRLSFYYANHMEASIRDIGNVLRMALPETDIIKKIIDAVWNDLSHDLEHHTELYNEAIESLFYELPCPSEMVYFRKLAARYCKEKSILH